MITDPRKYISFFHHIVNQPPITHVVLHSGETIAITDLSNDDIIHLANELEKMELEGYQNKTIQFNGFYT